MCISKKAQVCSNKAAIHPCMHQICCDLQSKVRFRNLVHPTMFDNCAYPTVPNGSLTVVDRAEIANREIASGQVELDILVRGTGFATKLAMEEVAGWDGTESR